MMWLRIIQAGKQFTPIHRPLTLSSRQFVTTVTKGPIPLAFDHLPPSVQASHTNPKDDTEIQQPILILHGLFGSRQNWRSLAKRINQKTNRHVFTLDLRNHGESGATPGSTTYLDYASDVEAFIEQHRLRNVLLIGHSMGGKVAMTVALKPEGPSIISKLVAVDISPTKGKISGDFQNYLEGMKQINATEIKTRKEADEILAKYENVGSLEVRQFLLTNLKKITDPTTKHDYYRIRLPLQPLSEQILTNQIGDFPFDPNQTHHPVFQNPTLFIKGKKSKYINRHSFESMRNFFPAHDLVEFDAGHWVHAEKPNEFIDTITQFFDDRS